MTQIRVLLADDHTIVRKGIRSLLDEEPNIDVVGEASDGREAIEQIEDVLPDVVLMDITMPNLNGIEATRQIVSRFPNVKVIALTMYTNEEYVFQLIQSGASGYLIKQSAPSELLQAIKAVNEGHSYFSPAISKTIVDYLRQSEDGALEDSYDSLTAREREVLQLVAEGMSNREIAVALHISEKTVSVHRTNMMEKLDLHNTTDVVKYALRRGIISLE